MKTLLTAILAAPLLLAQPGTGTLSGQILDERGRPIHGAKVDISAVPETTGPFRPFQAGKLTANDGSFAFSVAAGSYRICPQLSHSDLLNPCIWSRTPPRAEIRSGQILLIKPIVLLRGYPLTIQIQDGNALLTQEAVKHTANVVLVGVTAPNGMFHPIPVFHQNAAAREHRILVPRDMALNVSLLNRGFLLTDDKGTAVASTQAHTFIAKIAEERNPRVFTFVVTGLKQGAK